MTLRLRLALAILLSAIPLAAGLLLVRARLERSSWEKALREFALVQMQSGGREICEEAPEEFPDRARGPFRRLAEPGPRPPPGPADPRTPPGPGFRHRGPRPDPQPPTRLWAYDAELRSRNPRAPGFPAPLARAIDGEESAIVVEELEGRRVARVAARMPWSEGPCAVVLVERALPERVEDDRAAVLGLAILCGALLLATLLSAAPIVRRIRRLEREVRRAAASRYAEGVAEKGGDELGSLARAFNEAGRDVRAHLVELEARERTLRDFIANTTHDVMIPLTVLQGHLAALRRKAERGEPVDRDLLRDALEEAHYLGSLVHNLGAAAKLEAGEGALERHPVDLARLVERVHARHAPLAAVRGVALEHSVPETAPVTLGDVTLLEQAVGNLVHNAVRYNEAGGHVSILLRAEGAGFRLEVLDDGPGVSDAELTRLAERSYRGDAARRREPEGSGLGLAIARDVAARHGFRLRFERGEAGRGLRVTLAG